MSVLEILLPAFVQVGLIFALLFGLGYARYGALQTGTGDLAAYREHGGGWPRTATLLNNCYKHQFELPVLFFALVPLAMLTQKADFVFVVLAWLFVLSRVVHAVIYITTNELKRRSAAFSVGAVVLLLMWLKFLFDILFRDAMKPAAHAAAAIEVLTTVEAGRRPAADALKDWGGSHRFAGSRDRASIASIVYDALRHRASIAWLMGADTPRALALGALVYVRGMDRAALPAFLADSPHAPAPLTGEEESALASATLAGAPNWVRGDYPEWLDSFLARVFGDDRDEEAACLAGRAPLDLRVNALKGERDKALKALDHLGATATPLSPFGIRIPLLEDGRGPPVQSEPLFLKGGVEVQDEGSQLAALFAAAAPGEQVVDLCAGAGGKTLALSAGMNNRGQLFAYDRDIRRLAPLHERAERAGVRNLQVRSPRGQQDVLADLAGRADLVLVDAPCTGTGTWRRNPDAKWRLRPGSLEVRQGEQDAVLADAARLVKPGGRLVYITCSLLAEENDDRLAAFRTTHPEFSPVPAADAAIAANLPALAHHTNADGTGLLLTPRRTGTDGFFAAMLRKAG